MKNGGKTLVSVYSSYFEMAAPGITLGSMVSKSMSSASRQLGFWLSLPYIIVHELCHYVPARLLGMRASLHLRHCHISLEGRHYPDTHVLLVTLAPALLGLSTFLSIAVLALVTGTWFLLFLDLAFHIMWWLMCLSDFDDVWLFYREGRWPTRSGLGSPLTVGQWLRLRLRRKPHGHLDHGRTRS